MQEIYFVIQTKTGNGLAKQINGRKMPLICPYLTPQIHDEPLSGRKVQSFHNCGSNCALFHIEPNEIEVNIHSNKLVQVEQRCTSSILKNVNLIDDGIN